jgi:hypothetical protein
VNYTEESSASEEGEVCVAEWVDTVIHDFASKIRYSSHVCPRIICSTHMNIKCSQITKCHK